MSSSFLARFQNKINTVGKDGSVQRPGAKGGYSASSRTARNGRSRGPSRPVGVRKPSPLRSPRGPAGRPQRDSYSARARQQRGLDEPEGGTYGDDDPMMGAAAAVFTVADSQAVAPAAPVYTQQHAPQAARSSSSAHQGGSSGPYHGGHHPAGGAYQTEHSRAVEAAPRSNSGRGTGHTSPRTNTTTDKQKHRPGVRDLASFMSAPTSGSMSAGGGGPQSSVQSSSGNGGYGYSASPGYGHAPSADQPRYDAPYSSPQFTDDTGYGGGSSPGDSGGGSYGARHGGRSDSNSGSGGYSERHGRGAFSDAAGGDARGDKKQRRRRARQATQQSPRPSAGAFREMKYQQKESFSFNEGEYNPREANEERAKDAESQLYYSRRARPVDYKPKSLSEYKQSQPKKYVQLGSLGADINSDELVAKRANKERIKQFSKQLRRVNREQVVKARRRPAPPPKPVVKEKSKREKAREFAQQVPKPKPRRRTSGSDNQPQDPTKGKRTNVGMVLGTEHASKVEQLEMEHDKMRSDVDAIRREFGL